MNPLALCKPVSRSFYLSLRLLPRAMREPAALAYLLARASDTVADSATVPAPARLRALDALAIQTPPFWDDGLVASVPHAGECALLGQVPALLAHLASRPAAESALVREVTATIIGGQRDDLARFATASAQAPVALPGAAALENYTWQVAGCVGVFWTRLARLTLGSGFSERDDAFLIPLAKDLGMGLQLVNILRDLPADLAVGRCYLPVADPHDRGELLAAHHHWLERARGWVDSGFRYAAAIRSRRLRAASLLPAQLARETLAAMAGASWDDLTRRIKIPRHRVYALLVGSLAGLPRVFSGKNGIPYDNGATPAR